MYANLNAFFDNGHSWNISEGEIRPLRNLWLSWLDLGGGKIVRIFHEVSGNSYSIATIFGEDTDDFNKPKIIGLDQSFLKQ